MRAGEFDEILDECLSALLEGRRSIEDSLSLYPSLAGRLAPLLTAAAEAAQALASPSPSPYQLEEGRRRFLAAASVRKRALALVRGTVMDSDRQRTRAWRRWAALLSGCAVLMLAGGLTIRLLGGSDEPAPLGPRVILAVDGLRAAQHRLREGAISGQVSASLVQDLTDTTSELGVRLADLQTLDASEQDDLESAIRDQYALLDTLWAVDPEPEVAEALGLTEQLAARWGFDLPESSSPATAPPAEASPAASPAPEPQESPLPTPAPATSQAESGR